MVRKTDGLWLWIESKSGGKGAEAEIKQSVRHRKGGGESGKKRGLLDNDEKGDGGHGVNVVRVGWGLNAEQSGDEPKSVGPN